MPSVNLKAVVAVSTGIIAISGAAAVLGIKEFPRPAWASEIVEVAGNLIELDSRVTTQQLNDTKRQYYDNQRTQEELPTGHSVPDYLIEEQIFLEQQIDELEDRLKDLREQS